MFFPSPHPRLYCLLQSTDAHPGLADGVAPEGLLSPAELARCNGYKVLKRRRDWLLGRWTAKHLVQSYTQLVEGSTLPLDQIEVHTAQNGAPYVCAGRPMPVNLSISHSGTESFCAVCEEGVGYVGADVEQVEPRELAMVRSFFTPAENVAVASASQPERDTVITTIWSAKEAVLKTLRVGLRADTRLVDVSIPSPAPGWRRIALRVDPVLLPSSSSVITAWCQVSPARVLALAILHPAQQSLP